MEGQDSPARTGRSDTLGPSVALLSNRALLALILIGLFAVPAAADRFEEVREEATEAVASGQVPSLVVGVARRGEVIWAEAFGWANVEEGVPATIHTPYSIASVTKPFTATALMVLAEEGTLDLDRPANDWLDQVRIAGGAGDPAEATLRRVARHRAGLPLHHGFHPLAEGGPPTIDEAIRRHGFLATPPGQRFEYSNLGYGVLGRVLERATGQELSEILAATVAGPLGLEHTFLPSAPSHLDGRALRYGDDGEALPEYDTDHRGASSLWACLVDLLRFGSFHAGAAFPGQEGILSSRSRDAMQRPANPAGERAYGTGWSLTDRRGQRVVYHTGGMPGVSAFLALVPSQDLVVAVIANGHSELPLRLGEEILGRFVLPLPTGYDPLGGLRGGAGVGIPQEPGYRRRAPRRLRGRWRGSVTLSPEEKRPLALTVGKRDLGAAWGDGEEAIVHGAGFRGNELRSLVRTRLGPDDTVPGLAVLTLGRRDDRLLGAFIVVGDDAYDFPRAESYRVELHRD